MLSNKSIIFFINLTILFLFTAFGIIALFGINKILFLDNKNEFYYYIYVLVALINFIFFLVIFFKNIKIKFFLSISYISFFILFYFIEILLVYTAQPSTTFEMYEIYKKQNYNFVPHYRQRLFDTNNPNSGFPGKIYTLGGISKVGLVMTNENGFYPMTYHDQFGWTNLEVNYDNFDVALIGGSFVEGWSVKQEDNIVSNLKSKNINAISLAFAANGPMVMFATFKEYVMPFKPKKIIWFYSDDDLIEMQKNLDNKYLLKYLKDDSFSQNLIQRQNEIDTLMTNYALKNWEIQKRTHVRKYNYKRMIKLSNIRQKLKFYNKESKEKRIYEKASVEINQETFQTYNLIIKKTKEIANLWEAELYFVYIPSKYKFESYEFKDEFNKNLEIVLSMAKTNNIPILNLEERIIEKSKEPISLYSNHFNREGYKFAADQIALFISDK